MGRFKAFISYKHAASSRFAENLELALKAYAKPWLERPPAIFRDEKYLKPGVDLPGMIERALEESEFLIYLASPEAAASPWVERELELWCAVPERLERLIVVVTKGVLATGEDAAKIDWRRTDVLPAVLRPHLSTVPLYVDLTWAHDTARQTLLDPDFKKAVNLLAAAMRGIDPIELSGQEILQHRRNVRLRNTFVGAIALLALGVAVFAAVAVVQARSKSAQVSLVLAESARRAIAQGESDRAVRLAALAAREGPLEVADSSAAPTLAAAAHRSALVMDLRGHRERIRGVEAAPDGERLLTWSDDGSARVWRVETGAEIAAVEHAGWVSGARFDPAGQRVLSWGRDGVARVWDAATGAEIASTEHEDGVGGAVFDTAGVRVLSWSDDGVATVWDAATGADIAASDHGDRVWGAVFDSQGERVLSWGGRLVDPEDRERLLAIARVWDATTGVEIAVTRHEIPILGAVFDPAGERVLSWNGAGSARVWDAVTGAEISSFDLGEYVREARFDLAGERVFFCGTDLGPRAWDAATGAEIEPSGLECESSSKYVVKSSGRELAWTRLEKRVRIWDPGARDQLSSWRHEGRLYGAVFDPSGERVLSWSNYPVVVLAPDRGGIARVWDAATGGEIASLLHARGVRGAVFDPSGERVLSWGEYGRAWIWEPSAGSQADILLNSIVFDTEPENESAVFDPTGERVLFWDANFGEDWYRGNEAPNLEVWDVSTGTRIAAWRHEALGGAVFDAPGERVLSWSGNPMAPETGGDFARVWNASTGAEIAVSRHEAFVSGAVFDPSGERVLSWSADRIARVWDASTGAEIAALEHEGEVSGAIFDPSEKRVVSWGRDGSLRVWDAATGVEIATWKREAEVEDAIVTPSGERVLARSDDQTVSEWDVGWAVPRPSNRALIEEVCARKLRGTEVQIATNDDGETGVQPSIRRITTADAVFAPVLRDRVGEDVCAPRAWWRFALGREK